MQFTHCIYYIYLIRVLLFLVILTEVSTGTEFTYQILGSFLFTFLRICLLCNLFCSNRLCSVSVNLSLFLCKTDSSSQIFVTYNISTLKSEFIFHAYYWWDCSTPPSYLLVYFVTFWSVLEYAQYYLNSKECFPRFHLFTAYF